MKRLAFLTLALALLAQPAAAQIEPNSIRNCELNLTPVIFGTYFGERIDTTGRVQVVCEGTGQTNPFVVTLSEGQSNTFLNRSMTSDSLGLHTLEYNLYTDPAHTMIWGSGAGETVLQTGIFSFRGLGRQEVADFTAYSIVRGGQDPVPGSYRDVILVTVIF